MLILLGSFEFDETKKQITMPENFVPISTSKKAGSYRVVVNADLSRFAFPLPVDAVDSNTVIASVSGKTFGFKRAINSNDPNSENITCSIAYGKKTYTNILFAQYLNQGLINLIDRFGSQFADQLSVVGYYSSRLVGEKVYESVVATAFQIEKWTSKESRSLNTETPLNQQIKQLEWDDSIVF